MNTRYSFRNHPARQRWRMGLATLACAGLLASVSAQNVTLYSFANSAGGTLDPMSGSTILIGTGQDDAASAVTNIGFTFVYEGINYTQFSVSSNGNMRLGSTPVSPYQIYNLTNTGNEPAILPYSADGTTATGSISTTLVGSSPSQIRVIQWNVGTNYNDVTANSTYQVWLYEGSNVMEFRYGVGQAGSIGYDLIAIGGAVSSNYINIRPGPVASTTNPASGAVWPGDGSVYTFNPPSLCTPPPAPGNTLASATSGCPGVTSNLSLQNATSGSGVSYQWQSSPNGIAPWANVGPANPTYTTSALLATTWFRCEVTCSVGSSTVASDPVEITVSTPASSYQVFSGTQITEDFASWGDRCSTTDVPSSASNYWTNSPAFGPGTWRRNDQGASAGWANTSGYFYSDANGAVAPAARFHSREGGSVVGTLDYHIDMSAATGAELLRFEFINTYGNGTLQVLVSQDGGTGFTSLGTLNYLDGAAWTTKEFTIGSTSAQTVIRLKGTAGVPANGNDIGVDNFRIIPVASCAKPLAVAATVSGAASVDVNWTCASCTGSYIIEYGTTGFTPGTGATAGGGTVVTSNTMPATISGIGGGNYQVYVRQDCGGNDYSENSAPALFSFVAGDLCETAINIATISPSPVDLNNYTTFSTANASNQVTSSACVANTNGPDIILYHDVDPGATLKFVAQQTYAGVMSLRYGGTCPGDNPIYCTTGYYFNEGDPNDDDRISWTNNTCTTQRVYLVFDGATGASGTVYLWNYVYTTGPVVCQPVSGVTTNVTGSATAGVSWDATCSGNVIVEYGTAGFTPGTGASANGGTVVPVSGTSTSLSGLSMDMAYDVYVRNDCGNSEYGPNGTASTFTIFNGDDCSRVIALTGTTGALGINTTGTNNDISVCGSGNTGGDLVMSYIVEPGYGIYFTSTPAGAYSGQVRIAYGSSCPGTTELYCAAGAADYMWLNGTGVTQTVYFIQDGADEGATTVEWTYFPECAMLDTDNDGINDCDDSCINFPGQVGDPCMNGSIPGTISADCQCVTVCTGNEVVVVINTDYNPTETTWEITDANNVVVATGGPSAAQEHMLVSQTTCIGTVPGDACYGFKLMDGYGDGINNGSWQLKSTSGRVLLGDDFANGTRSPSAVPSTPGYTQHSFCLPPGNCHIASTSCGRFDYKMINKVLCNNVPGATSYQFEFSNPDAGFIRRIAVPVNSVGFNQMVTSPLTPGVKYFARVRSNAAGAMADAHFGGGCELGMSSTLPCTELISAPNYGYSCGQERTFNTNNSFIYATPVVGATEYQFRISIPSEGYDRTFIRSTYILQLKWNATVAPPLVNGSTYNVQVNVKVGTQYSGFCGDVCTITINNNPGNAMRPEASMSQVAFGEATLWPNPVRESQVNLSIDGIQDADQHITVDIQDIYGKKVFAKEFGNSGERFTTILDLPGDIASGIYMVNITVNGQTTVQRLSIIK